MSLPRLSPVSALRSLAKIQGLLERRGRADQWLFEARGEAHQLAHDVGSEGFPALQPICLAIRDLFGQLLRHGLDDADEILLAMGRLVGYVNDRLQSAVSAQATPFESRMLQAPGATSAPKMSLSQSGPTPAGQPANPAAGPTPDHRLQLGGSEAWRLVNETRLGEVIIRLGFVDGKTLDQALVLQQVGCKRLGEVLVGMGKLSPEKLQLALDKQREMTLKLTGSLSFGSGLNTPSIRRDSA